MFSRQTYWSGEQLQSANFLQQQRDNERGVTSYILDSLGASGAIFTGLTATPGASGLSVNIGRGSLYQYNEIDPTAWSSLAADTNNYMLQGLLLPTDPQQIITGFSAPTTSGQSRNYLIEAQIQVTDTTAVLTPFYTASGQPANYVSKSPSRRNVIAFQIKAGTAATTGTQTTPTADSGWVPLWQIEVDYGNTAIQSYNISLASGAPFFMGFVHQTNTGVTYVQLSPSSQQTGNMNISGTAIIGSTTTIGGSASIGGNLSANGNLSLSTTSGTTMSFGPNGYIAGNTGSMQIGFTGNGTAPVNFYTTGLNNGATFSVNTDGSATVSGGYIQSPLPNTKANPAPLSNLNVKLFQGYQPSDFALASGNYVILSSTPNPSPETGYASITGNFTAAQFISSVATSNPPFIVSSTTQVANLNASYVAGLTPGNTNGSIAINNGILNTNLNAQYLGGYQASAFQLAGAYPVMNAYNTGGFYATGSIGTNGGTNGTLIQMNYVTTNNENINGGGACGALSASTALGLIGPFVQTQGPIYVGGNSTVGGGGTQNLYAQDVVPSGITRGGIPFYRVTFSTSSAYPYPGNGTNLGTWTSMDGSFSVGADTVRSEQFWIGYRMVLKVKTAFSATFYGMGIQNNPNATDAQSAGGAAVYVNASKAGVIGGDFGGLTLNIPAGTVTIDIVYQATSMNQPYYIGSQGNNSHVWGGNFTCFGWIPQANQAITTSITNVLTT